jgi:hypothetical protein
LLRSFQEITLGVVEAHPVVIEDHPRFVDDHPVVIEDRPEVIEDHTRPGVMNFTIQNSVKLIPTESQERKFRCFCKKFRYMCL